MNEKKEKDKPPKEVNNNSLMDNTSYFSYIKAYISNYFVNSSENNKKTNSFKNCLLVTNKVCDVGKNKTLTYLLTYPLTY